MPISQTLFKHIFQESSNISGTLTGTYIYKKQNNQKLHVSANRPLTPEWCCAAHVSLTHFASVSHSVVVSSRFVWLQEPSAVPVHSGKRYIIMSWITIIMYLTGNAPKCFAQKYSTPCSKAKVVL